MPNNSTHVIEIEREGSVDLSIVSPILFGMLRKESTIIVGSGKSYFFRIGYSLNAIDGLILEQVTYEELKEQFPDIKSTEQTKNEEYTKREIETNNTISSQIKRYVQDSIEQWQQKGEFEKTSDYVIRVNEQTRKTKVQQLANDALKPIKAEYARSINWQSSTLGKYDADNETFLVSSPQFGQFAIPVPVSDAPSFKQSWSQLQWTNADFFLNNETFSLAKVQIVNPTNGKSYQYDSKHSTTYAASNINYNFKPIEVDVQNDKTENNTKIETKSMAVGSSDVDMNIPESPQTNDKTFVVIIANENYKKEITVKYGVNDGKIFKEYCQKTLGIPANNIHFAPDASFGDMRSELKWISEVAKAYNGQAKLIFYYAGHGMPNEATKSAYLLPVDGNSSDYETAIKLEDLYAKLNENPTKNVTVFLDACFSGSQRDEGMLAQARGVRLKANLDVAVGNSIVFSAATGDETAYPFKEKQHGLFTYFLLKKLQETKGDVTYGDLYNYIRTNVNQQSIVVNQKSQTPQVQPSPALMGNWSGMMVK